MSGRTLVLTGGVGGAKLVLGLQQVVEPSSITAIVNTGDDFRHLGLWVSPDIDTLLYTLSGQANAAQGWGREGETWAFMEALRRLGGEDWFALGDGDLALHVLRSARLATGDTLTTITADFASAWGIGARILPMSDQPVSTHLDTDEGDLAFQTYFVEKRCLPVVRRIDFQGAAAARPGPDVISTILAEDVRAILIAPSNPYLSIDPILAVPGIRDALHSARAPVVVVSPVVGGNAVKGPTAKLMRELGSAVSPEAVLAHYGDVVDAMLVDERDAVLDLGVPYDVCDTLMHTLADRARVARAALALADRLQ
ncbi:Phosphoenolpyruvate transferase [Brevundimonas sp. NIBR10]|uniref:2-phospho-L-lactate transferase n=1 Tax=Brevundimonas sp. NIBR10 TaxID=3015997 RepID=UPI0022F1AD53|nr:2-phospho-L-lactate transferase [Brevundimonas sp. NIBR10]WGM47532.1 Phosphoenolpyruvate transferase [Brevundimonas sp. NIBR10]